MITSNYYTRTKHFLLNKLNVKFLFFILAATLFWFALKLNEEKTYDIAVPLQYEPAPGYEIIQGEDQLLVTVQGDVIDINRLDGKTLTIPLSDERRQIIDYNIIKSLLTSKAPKNTVIIGMTPGSIEILLSPQVNKKVPVVINYQINLPRGFSLTVPPQSIPDSITVMGTSELLHTIEAVFTQEVNVNKIQKNNEINVPLLQPHEEIVFTPQQVEVSFFVDQMIEKEFSFALNDFFGELGFTRNSVNFTADIPMSEYDKIDLTNFSFRLDSTAFPNRKVLRVVSLLPQIKNINPVTDTLIIINNVEEF